MIDFAKMFIRYLGRRRFAKALDKADWRTAYLPSDAAYEVLRLRSQLTVDPWPVTIPQGQVVARVKQDS